jgi:Transglycosylase SLT domain
VRRIGATFVIIPIVAVFGFHFQGETPGLAKLQAQTLSSETRSSWGLHMGQMPRNALLSRLFSNSFARDLLTPPPPPPPSPPPSAPPKPSPDRWVSYTPYTPPPPPRVPVYTGSHSAWMAAASIPPSDWGYVNIIVSEESGWDPEASNREGAYGLCQSLPADKMASAGSDWRSDPVTQLEWCSSYAAQRYGGWANAAAFHLAHNWW